MTDKTNPDIEEERLELGNYHVKGKLYPTDTVSRISELVDVPENSTPGNVGLCFSGGGSVAMIASLGQLRALHEMGFLGKARAISSVSGGSWTVVPFTFLPNAISDETFLGDYVADQDTLTLDDTPLATSLKYTPQGYLGTIVTDSKMRWTHMAVEALKLASVPGFPHHRIWNYLIGRNILAPLGLDHIDWLSYKQDPSWFAYSTEDAESIKAQNKDLPVQHYVYQQGDGRIRRPFHLCNTSMFITPNDNASEGNMLAPVQSTAIGTGILANSLGTPEEGAQQVGGGLASSYCFDSLITEVDHNNNTVTVEQKQKDSFSLADITANSSAFFATALPKLGSGVDPSYKYWPVAGASADDPGVNCNFADGGAIEDSGIANMLAYDDIHSVVSFINALQTVFRDDTNPDNEKNIVTDMWLPSLFGYTPYMSGEKTKKDPNPLKKGYHLYKDLSSGDLNGKNIRYFQHNQVFPSCEFFPFTQELLKNAKDYTAPAVYYNEKMSVIENPWFRVKGGKTDEHGQPEKGCRTIKLLLIHYNPITTWIDKLKPSVFKSQKRYVKKTKRLRKNHPKSYPPVPTDTMFPNFVLTQTHMPADIMNLFAHFTAYGASTQQEKLENMFKD